MKGSAGKTEKLWYAVALLPDEMIEEAAVYTSKGPGYRRLWLIAALAALLLLGCVAGTWLFAPGQGIVPARADTGVTVFASEERCGIGDFVLEAAFFSRNTDNPAEDRLMFWWYCAEQEKLQYWPEVWVNGRLFQFSSYRMTVNSNLCCYTYMPAGNASADVTQEPEEGVTLRIRPETGEAEDSGSLSPAGEAAEIHLQAAESGDITRIRLDGEKYVSFLPLTDTVFMGSFHDPAPITYQNVPAEMRVSGNFTLRFADGTESELSGWLSMDGMQTRTTGVVSDRYDQPLESAVLHSLDIALVYYQPDTEAAPSFSFPLMAVGEAVSCDIPVWSEGGLEIRLVSVYRDEQGLHSAAVLRNMSGDSMITEGSAQFAFYTADDDSGACSVSPEDTGEIVTGTRYRPDGTKTYDRILTEGTEIHMRLAEVRYTYAHADGTALGEIGF